jgi:hypothetical protein
MASMSSEQCNKQSCIFPVHFEGLTRLQMAAGLPLDVTPGCAGRYGRCNWSLQHKTAGNCTAFPYYFLGTNMNPSVSDRIGQQRLFPGLRCDQQNLRWSSSEVLTVQCQFHLNPL